MNRYCKIVFSAALIMSSAGASADTILTNDEAVIRQDLCVGPNCLDNEVYDSSNNGIRIKGDRVRIDFVDTSGSGFPDNDWRIIANDASGTAEYFGIQDVSANRIPFRIEAGARHHALYVESSGEVGVGTSNPVVEMHLVSGDTPSVRLDQDNSSGFAEQAWDVAGNETSFFVRDATNGSTLPFRIRPGAPSNALVIDTDGEVGIGILSPDSPLHVVRSDDTQEFMFLQSTNAGPQDRAMMYLENSGGIRFEFRDTNQTEGWRFQAQTGGNDRFEITKVGTGEIEFDLRQNGNLRITGNLFTNSDVNSKQDIVPVDGGAVLSRLDALPVSEWSYKDAADIRHLGPMAQDFHAQFGLGEDDTSIAPMDLAGVSLAAVKAVRQEQQALQTQLVQKNQEIRDLKSRLETLEALILQKTQTALVSE